MNEKYRHPYKKEREAEYAIYKKLTIRAAPAFLSGYVIYVNPDLQLLDKARDILVIAVMYGLVNYCYSKLAKDTYIFSVAVLAAWAGLIYEWWFVDGVNFIGSFFTGGRFIAARHTTVAMV